MSKRLLMHWFRHEWESIAVDHLEQFRTLHGVRIGDPSDDLPITKVLQRCACSDLRTITLDGSWTLEQVEKERA